MEKTKAVKAKMPMVSLRSVVPVVPKDESKKLQLVEDQTRIRCKGLLAQPWNLKSNVVRKNIPRQTQENYSSRNSLRGKVT